MLIWKIVACVVGVVALVFTAMVVWDVFVPKVCGQCGKRLKCLNFIRAHPGPSYSTFRCASCGAEFVQVNGRMEPRAGSKWEYEQGW
ncbi:MAG: hypothetical protein H0V44_02525 [Planctomycetes bacterium]|nr:hypothetical protein [Planctomycetota bacterium]